MLSVTQRDVKLVRLRGGVIAVQLKLLHSLQAAAWLENDAVGRVIHRTLKQTTVHH